MLIVKFWKDMMSNPDGIPGEWPAETAPYRGAIPDGFILMTDEELIAHKTLHQETFNTWQVTHKEKIARALYAESRAAAYPPVGAQLDMIYKAMKNGLIPEVPDFVQAIDAVKQQFPKPEVQ